MIAVFDNMLLEILRKTREEINGTIYNKHVWKEGTRKHVYTF